MGVGRPRPEGSFAKIGVRASRAVRLLDKVNVTT